VIYLYAITDTAAGVPEEVGLDDAELVLARASEVAGLYSTHEWVGVRAEPGALWRHEQVVEAAMEAGPTLPVRFGTTFEDDDALLTSLEREGRRLHRQLQRVAGCVELAVRVGLVDAATASDSSAASGRGYLESKLSTRRSQQSLVRDTLRPLSRLSVSARHLEGSPEQEAVRASYLVRSDQVGRFSEEVTLVAERNPQLWLSLTGPWPPYSFAELETAA
jgi:Gas vesicle synthesis protein GvpL/GvpF